jgi:hypothetical protein
MASRAFAFRSFSRAMCSSGSARAPILGLPMARRDASRMSGPSCRRSNPRPAAGRDRRPLHSRGQVSWLKRQLDQPLGLRAGDALRTRPSFLPHGSADPTSNRRPDGTLRPERKRPRKRHLRCGKLDWIPPESNTRRVRPGGVHEVAASANEHATDSAWQFKFAGEDRPMGEVDRAHVAKNATRVELDGLGHRTEWP